MYRNRPSAIQISKTCNIFTPVCLSEGIFGLLNKKFDKDNCLILDPCVGSGQLLSPGKNAGYKVEAIDIEDKGFPNTRIIDYLLSEKKDYENSPRLVVINPPFNIHEDMEEQKSTFKYLEENGGTRRPFLPEVFLAKTIELFGKETPILLFTPYGLRFNLTLESRRFLKFDSGDYPEIRSIITLPKNIYNLDKGNILKKNNEGKGIIFHSEILLFNIKGLKGHYFLPRKLANNSKYERD